ncbi:MAG: hypothetical protein KC593_03880 [Myxococcales bacterium]|nr:hypothetical protein [Myxococcales bacterium]MCB9627030.1 hypothetical protein [Sandaracinaceae bacterium]
MTTEAPPWHDDHETERDQVESAFTPLLRSLYRAAPGVIAAVFVDHEGECVDYCVGIDPYDAKVAGAHLILVLSEIQPRVVGLMAGDALDFIVYGSERDLMLRRVSDGFALIVLTSAGTLDEPLLEHIELVVHAIRTELDEAAPIWDVRLAPIEVAVRESGPWVFAPELVRRGDEHIPILDVMGRWEEGEHLPGGKLVCFRVHTERYRELTLAFDVANKSWFAW